ncbi:MAG TPA: maleylacetoacetate isomerase [Caulobacteraceae bacterium]
MWRATAPYRVRIALNLKGLEYRYAAVDLAGGEQRAEPYRAVNPQGLVPALEIDGRTLIQSGAILEWLEETHPAPPLLPPLATDRAVVRAMAAIVGADIHPLNNLRVLQALAGLGFPIGGPEQKAWGARWITEGFMALEPLVARYGAGFAFGAAPTLADCFLIPQIWAASRFDVRVEGFPALAAVAARAGEHPAFLDARPENQPDAARHVPVTPERHRR